MDRNELESPLSLPTAKLEQHDSEYMKENFNISETVLLYKWGFKGPLLYFVLHICTDRYAYTSLYVFVGICDA